MKTTVRRDGPQEPPKTRYSPFDSEVLLQNFAAQNDRPANLKLGFPPLPSLGNNVDHPKTEGQPPELRRQKQFARQCLGLLHVTWQPKYSATILSDLDDV
ncbi:unnamed protein product [Colletotrichum noveboracense]|uniref:Uncharacterized protein n=1 Tax=Colletotrichum noveboracense TaxID=2664923 RepID=A0A9W4RZG1_9PEZI|nr:unnamed protein product [Colletotrichum noveboracense]